MKGILCFGDSISFGRGEIPAIGWVGRLKRYFESKDPYNGVYNLGVSGHTSTDLVKRFDAEADGRIRIHRPENKFLILVAIGTNDCKWDGLPENNDPRTTKEQFKKNIISLLESAKNKPKTTIALIGLPPVNEELTLPFEETSFENKRVELFNNILKELANEYKISFLDIYNILLKEDYPKLLSDGLHPNEAGYELMFKEIKKFIEDNDLI